MGTAFSFGSFYPGNGVLYRLDPRTKLLCGLAFIIMILFAKNILALAAVAAFVALLYALARIPLANALKSLAPLLFIVLFASILNLFMAEGGAVLFQMGFIRITEAGVYQCAFIACRLLLMMMGMSLLTLTTPTLDLTEAFERLLTPFARFGLPAHELGMIMGIALRFMPQFATELTCIYHAQISRGAALSNSPVKGVRMLSSLMIPLFTSVFRHAETLAQAMDARCYHGSQGRTRLHPLTYAKRDAFAACALAALAMAIIAANLLA